MDKSMRVDFHMHSTASDGTWTPEKLVENVLNAGIGLFALTDHDSTDNIAAVKDLALTKGLAFVPGVEVCSLHENKTFHILGLGICPGHTELEAMLEGNRHLMDEKDDEGIQYLESLHPQRVSFQEYLAYKDNRERGGWKSLNYLKDKGLCTNNSDFFNLYSQWPGFFEQVNYPSPDKVIATIKAAGGVPVLAHPGSRMYDADISKLLPYFLEAGIMGFECFHPDNSQEVTEQCLSFCKQHGLRITGGSDCHGEFVKSRRLGLPSITLSMLYIDGINILTPTENT